MQLKDVTPIIAAILEERNKHMNSRGNHYEQAVCAGLRMELKTAGKGVRQMYKQPRCSLFKVWLDKPSIYTLRCDKCKLACGEEV